MHGLAGTGELRRVCMHGLPECMHGLPDCMHGLPSLRRLQVSCGAQHTCVLAERGGCLLTFGWGSTGALGHGSFGYQLTAKHVDALRGRRLVGVCAGGRHTVVIEEGVAGGAALPRDLGDLLTSASAAGGADCAIRAGRGPGARRFVAHKCVLACRCPRLLAMFAFSSSRFSRPPSALAPEWQWRGQMSSSDAPKAASALPELALPSIRAPICALLLTWVYTGRFHSTERLFLEQLAAAATELRLPALAHECHALCGETGEVHGGGEGAATTARASSSLAGDLGALIVTGSVPHSFADLRLGATDGFMYGCSSLLSCRCDFFRTLLQGSFREAAATEHHTVDLTPYGISLAELRLLLRFIYCGQITSTDDEHGADGGGDLAHLPPSDALALIPHASALLMDDLKRLCEAVLVAVVDEENAAALLEVAERCFAVRLKATCEGMLSVCARHTMQPV